MDESEHFPKIGNRGNKEQQKEESVEEDEDELWFFEESDKDNTTFVRLHKDYDFTTGAS